MFFAPRGPSLASEVAMGMERWHPKREATRQEQFILKRLEKKRKLFGFLRNHRHEIFDDEFQAELESIYRDTGAGSEARTRPPCYRRCRLRLLVHVGRRIRLPFGGRNTGSPQRLMGRVPHVS